MTARGSGRLAILGAVIALSAPLLPTPAEAARHGHSAAAHDAFLRGAAFHGGSHRFTAHWYGGPFRGHWGRARAVYRSAWAGGISCVPYARENSGIELSGNAATWWDHAAGVYARGNQPEIGSVLNFRATGRMPLGHVAVVTDLRGPRAVEIDHANWASRGSVSQGVLVEDVSPANDWTEVRVALGNGDFGSVYPTYGFIYDRPDQGGTMLASARGGSMAPEVDEVAELPDASNQQFTTGSHHPRLQAEEARRRRRYSRHRRYYHG